MAILTPGCFGGQQFSNPSLLYSLDYWPAPMENYHAYFTPSSVTRVSHPHLHFLWCKGHVGASSSSRPVAEALASRKPTHPCPSPAYHLFSHLGWTILFQNDWHVFTSYKDHGYQPRNGRGASALSMSSHMAGGTAAGRHILAAQKPFLSIATIPSPGMFYRMAAWACCKCLI